MEVSKRGPSMELMYFKKKSKKSLAAEKKGWWCDDKQTRHWNEEAVTLKNKTGIRFTMEAPMAVSVPQL